MIDMCDMQIQPKHVGQPVQSVQQADAVRPAADADDQRNLPIFSTCRHELTIAQVLGDGRQQWIFLRFQGRFWGCGVLTDHGLGLYHRDVGDRRQLRSFWQPRLERSAHVFDPEAYHLNT